MAKRKSKVFIWQGKVVSRSTFFRRHRADQSIAATRVRIAAETAKAEQPAVMSPGDVKRVVIATKREEDRSGGEKLMFVTGSLERERVETFMLMANHALGGSDDTHQMVVVPVKVWKAAVLALRQAGY